MTGRQRRGELEVVNSWLCYVKRKRLPTQHRSRTQHNAPITLSESGRDERCESVTRTFVCGAGNVTDSQALVPPDNVADLSGAARRIMSYNQVDPFPRNVFPSRRSPLILCPFRHVAGTEDEPPFTRVAVQSRW